MTGVATHLNNNQTKSKPGSGDGTKVGLFANPRAVSPDECWFYHVMDLPGLGLVGGHWDLRGRIHEYIGHVEFAGKRVLDIGTASGFLTFEMERLGAEVVSFDADSAARMFFGPYER